MRCLPVPSVWVITIRTRIAITGQMEGCRVAGKVSTWVSFHLEI
ncbi:WSSV316 [White spot syndrome virus]|uniref:WSSV316 n=1 Tax=White spot syndrome virus TaxID=342409 RepID=A0A2I6SC22_9VIRU|nr:WSSV316 [White spot syndrome virus]